MIQKVNNHVMLTDTAYSIGKKLVQIVIPAFSALYFGLAAVWGLPAAEQVVGSLAVLATFLGAVLGLSSKQYDESEAAFDGTLEVETNDTGRTLFSLQVDGDPEELAKKGAISFKVAPKT